MTQVFMQLLNINQALFKEVFVLYQVCHIILIYESLIFLHVHFTSNVPLFILHDQIWWSPLPYQNLSLNGPNVTIETIVLMMGLKVFQGLYKVKIISSSHCLNEPHLSCKVYPVYSPSSSNIPLGSSDS